MSFEEIKHLLIQDPFPGELCEKELQIHSGARNLKLLITSNPAGIQSQDLIFPLDYVKTMPKKLLAILGSKLGLNKSIFARNCILKKVSRQASEDFLTHYHLLGYTNSAFNYGLFYKNELVAVAAFSKGRKMNRLPDDKRSFELIRFCCKSGISVAGGLTRLVKNFFLEKKAGDIMTYIDKQLSDGRSFINAGFKLQGESAAMDFLVNKTTYERSSYKGGDFDPEQFYRTSNLGNLKLIFTPGE